MTVVLIAAQHGLLASPVSAATVALFGALAGHDIGLPRIMLIIVPSTFVAVLIGALSVTWKGVALSRITQRRDTHDDGN